jgi:hypothetical protein
MEGVIACHYRIAPTGRIHSEQGRNGPAGRVFIASGGGRSSLSHPAAHSGISKMYALIPDDGSASWNPGRRRV